MNSFSKKCKREGKCVKKLGSPKTSTTTGILFKETLLYYALYFFFVGEKTMEKLRTARLNKHKRQGRFLLISNLNGEFPQNTIGKCKFHYSTILEMWWPLFHWISHLRWILLNSREMKSEHLLDRITHSPAIEH